MITKAIVDAYKEQNPEKYEQKKAYFDSILKKAPVAKKEAPVVEEATGIKKIIDKLTK